MDDALGRELILDELFDLTLYQRLAAGTRGDLKKMLEELVPVEQKHVAFWEDFFHLKAERLDAGRRTKMAVILLACRVFGESAVHLVLEGIEIYGVRKYLGVWQLYKDQPLGAAVRGILMDEFQHEDAIVSRMTTRKIDPERIRSVFLGFNDGLVEILGAVSGFFAAFADSSSVLMAGATVAVAGALSMAAGVYVSSGSEKEVLRVQRGKSRFLGRTEEPDEKGERLIFLAALVGISYLAGAAVPVLPVLLGAKSVFVSVLCSGTMIVALSWVLSFLSGMDARKRILTNLVIISAAVGVSSLIGWAARALWGLNL